ncbi:MAG: methyltransferase, CheR-type, partial [Frankiales bacterium]|nr:methyltransferase, CheR-type [Frankiales bacterium]
MSVVDDAAALVQRRSGLQLDAVMRTRLQRTLLEQRRAGESDTSLLARLEHDPAALQVLYDELTVQETSFFRDPGQFTGLARTVLPLLPDPVVLWSAGCSNGQEAWSLAMVLAEQGRQGRVVASDLSERALARTRSGRYAERELRGLSPERRARWLVRDDDAYRVVPELRDRVTVVRHNLAGGDPPPVPGCSVVFCRNVLIYFSRADVVAAVRRFAALLPREGWLFLGFSESLWELTDVFTPVRLDEAYAYRPVGAPVPEQPRRRAGAVPAVPVLSDLSGAGPVLPPR